jgi:hypothetical protein
MPKHKPVTRTRVRKPPFASFNTLTPRKVRALRKRLAEQRLLNRDTPTLHDDIPSDSDS